MLYRAGGRGSREAFTLVELLVVIGIVAVLIAILMPALGRARESARRVKCLSNLHQIATALVAYTGDNDQYFPRPAIGTGGETPEDWVYWSGAYKNNPSGGRIAKYLGGAGALSAVMVCPDDDVSTHQPFEGAPYPYSYTVNEFLCRTQIIGHLKTLRMTAMTHPGSTIMVICESSATIDDGCWAPQHYVALDQLNLLSNRHDQIKEDRYDYKASDQNAGRGNVAYADGHASFVPRSDSLDPDNYLGFPGEDAN
jgi:prepilin-type N-terminal cleavage/methylation domain-containing protein/prepilin-type processing-associated H-X9-DG protein